MNEADLTTTRQINEIVIHCSATTANMNVDARWIDRVHRTRGFTRIGYHFVILRDGTVEKGRPLSQAGAHVRGHNHDTIGICLVGGLDAKRNPENNFTPAQFAALASLLIDLRKVYPYADILGHRDYSPDLDGDGKITSNEWMKDCPCFDVREWLKTTSVLHPVGSYPVLDGCLFYEVQPGDTLFSIAKAHGTTVRNILAKNDWITNPSLIRPGDFIYLPAE